MSALKKTILGLIGEKIFEAARVISVEKISTHFRLITLETPSFAKTHWRPGEKVQINVGDWNVRTYTPISLDPLTSQMKLLVFIHGHGPGAEWAFDLEDGDLCQIMGPRSSLSVSPDDQARVLFGDETSFAVATTLKKFLAPETSVQFVFEVNSIEESKMICEKFGILETAFFVEKQKDGSHLDRVFQKLGTELKAEPKKQLLLTGNAKSIQKIRAHFRASRLPQIDLANKPYWSPGKIGLD